MITNALTPDTVEQLNVLLQHGEWSIRGCDVNSASIEDGHLTIGKFRRHLGNSKQWSFKATEASIQIHERKDGKTRWKKVYQISNAEPLKRMLEGLVAQRQQVRDRQAAEQAENHQQLTCRIYRNLVDLAGEHPVEISFDPQTVKITFSNGQVLQIWSGGAVTGALLIGSCNTDMVPIAHSDVISL